jgi:hypothetical protein
MINIRHEIFLKLMNELILNDLVQLEVKHFQKNFYKDDVELDDWEFRIEEEDFDKVEYVNELILDLNKKIDY